MAQIQPINIDFSPLDQAFALRRQALGERADKQEAAQAEQSRANQEQVAFDRGMQILQLKGQQEKDILAQKGEQSTNLQELKGRQEVEQQDDPAAQFRASVPVINNILTQLGKQEDPELLQAFLGELQQFEQFEAFKDLDFSSLEGQAPKSTKPEKTVFEGKEFTPFDLRKSADKMEEDDGRTQRSLKARLKADGIDFDALRPAVKRFAVNNYISEDAEDAQKEYSEVLSDIRDIQGDGKTTQAEAGPSESTQPDTQDQSNSGQDFERIAGKDTVPKGEEVTFNGKTYTSTGELDFRGNLIFTNDGNPWILPIGAIDGQQETVEISGRIFTKTGKKTPDGKFDILLDENGMEVINQK